MSARESLSGPAAEPTPLTEHPRRSFEAGGAEWVAWSLGHGQFGVSAGRAPLLAIGFGRADAAERIVREVLWVARDFDALTESELVAALDRARPVESDPDSA